MRKRTINYLYISLIWILLSLLPLIYYFAINWHSATLTLDLSSCLEQFGINSSNDIYLAIDSIFGSNSSILPLFTSNSGVLLYVCYLINITLLRLIIDVLLWLPNYLILYVEKIGGSVNAKD